MELTLGFDAFFAFVSARVASFASIFLRLLS